MIRLCCGNHGHRMCHKKIYHFQKFPSAPLIYYYCYFFVLRTHIRSSHSEVIKRTVCVYLMVSYIVLYKSSLVDWVFQEANFETEICMQKCYSILSTIVREEWIKQIGQRAMLGCISDSKGCNHSMGLGVPALTSHCCPKKGLRRWTRWLSSEEGNHWEEWQLQAGTECDRTLDSMLMCPWPHFLCCKVALMKSYQSSPVSRPNVSFVFG